MNKVLDVITNSTGTQLYCKITENGVTRWCWVHMPSNLIGQAVVSSARKGRK